jgi:hypothetical protein
VRATPTSVAQGAGDCSGSAACFPARMSVPRPMTKRPGIMNVAPASRVSAGSSFALEARVVERAYRLRVVEVGAATHGGSDERGTRHEKDVRSQEHRELGRGIKSAVAMREGNWCRERALEEPALDRV